MSFWEWFFLIMVAGFILVVVVFGRAAVRFFRGDTEMESGGSFGHQLTDDPDEPPR